MVRPGSPVSSCYEPIPPYVHSIYYIFSIIFFLLPVAALTGPAMPRPLEFVWPRRPRAVTLYLSPKIKTLVPHAPQTKTSQRPLFAGCGRDSQYHHFVFVCVLTFYVLNIYF